jgi:hypothetical protein
VRRAGASGCPRCVQLLCGAQGAAGPRLAHAQAVRRALQSNASRTIGFPPCSLRPPAGASCPLTRASAVLLVGRWLLCAGLPCAYRGVALL